jgi:hypothetical protein
MWRLVAGFAPVGTRSRATSVARLKTVFFGFANPTSVMTEGSVFILVRRVTPVARERAPTGCIRGPRGCTGQPAAHGYSTGSGVLNLKICERCRLDRRITARSACEI